jgi:asparagine synthase (glutamine-hydrolysing)
MCGIGGILSSRLASEELRSRVVAMQDRLRHRGPDGNGIFVHAEAGTALVHSRLAILDLSDAGLQPMSSPDGRYTIVFNGEIYNFQQLKLRLEQVGERFQSSSDTEVLLRLYQRDGGGCVYKLDGMFAFAIWDRQERTCFFARDPLGIKPLYLWKRGQSLAFASEVRALLSAELGPREISAEALYEYFLFGSVQEPLTLVRGIEMLPAGHTLLWRDGHGEPCPYWQLMFSAQRNGSKSAVSIAREALDDSIRRHFVSDVPVGIFLSGGIDSTAIVALAKANGFERLNTLCISFDDAAYDEGKFAAETAAHFGTHHHDLRLTAKEGRDTLSDYLNHIDQPSNDGFNSFWVSKLAREQGLKVVLSGLGGDELFGSYKSFRIVPRITNWFRRSEAIGGIRHVFGLMAERFAAEQRYRRVGAFLQSPGRPADAYWAVRGFFTPREAKALVEEYAGGTHGDLNYIGCELPRQPTLGDEVSYVEITQYMRNQLLRDSDVMSMAWGLELRVPLADRKLVDALAPITARIRLASGKKLLLDAVPEIPESVAHRPKRGFSFPFDKWICEQWQDIFEETWGMIGSSRSTWYRHWCLFTLNHFLRQNKIDAGVPSSRPRNAALAPAFN